MADINGPFEQVIRETMDRFRTTHTRRHAVRTEEVMAAVEHTNESICYHAQQVDYAHLFCRRF